MEATREAEDSKTEEGMSMSNYVGNVRDNTKEEGGWKIQ